MIINGTDYDHLFDSARIRVLECIEGIPSAKQMIEQKSNLLIVSDGASHNTHVYCNGVEINNITFIEIEKIYPRMEIIRAKIGVEIAMSHLHMRAEAVHDDN